MALTDAQKTTLAAGIRAETNPGVVAALAIRNDVFLTEWLNADSAQVAWNPRTNVRSIVDSISWDKFTPVDAADSTVFYSNRLLLIQTKQMNLQTILSGRDTLDATLPNIRAALRDAVITLPAGTAGATISAGGAGGVNVLTACTRPVTNAERYLGGIDATTGPVTAKVLNWTGTVSNNDVGTALNANP